MLLGVEYKLRRLVVIGTIERIKNSVLLKCSTLNDDIISKTLVDIIDTGIYRFAEEMINLLGGIGVWGNEEELRNETSEIIKNPIIKKIKRKLFIDSLALQITNDTFIEDYVNGNITMDKLNNTYIKELTNNKSSNQLNMTEDLNISDIIDELRIYVDRKTFPKIMENKTLVNSVSNLVNGLKNEMQANLEEMIKKADSKYLDILLKELKDEVKEEKGEDDMMENTPSVIDSIEINDLFNNEQIEANSKFEQYDDMTLFNKMILSLNTEEEKLSRKENKLKSDKEEVEKRLSDTNKNIEANIERENMLSQRKLDLNAEEVELNSKLSEAEVIFLNMKPLIKGLSKIKGGNEDE